MRDFDGSQVFYRLALASQKRATQRLVDSQAGDGDAERLNRSFDACIEAVVLLQSSAEAWINRQYETSGVPARGGGWIARWSGIGHIAAARGRAARSLSPQSVRLLEEIGRLRNFLVHGDATSKARLEAATGGRDLHDFLTAASVRSLLERTETLWIEASDITGQQVPFARHAWIAFDEWM